MYRRSRDTPPVLGHKVVTLAPQIHGGLLASLDELEELKTLRWSKIDLLLVTFYPLELALSAENATLESCLKSCDIGGPTLVRSAVKGGEVIVLTDMSQTVPAINWIRGGEPKRRLVLDALRGKSEQAVAEYIRMSASIHSEFRDLNAAKEYGF